MKGHKLRIITLATMLTLAVSASFCVAFASWQFNQADQSAEVTNVGITNWTFAAIDDGTTITIDDSGNVVITDGDGQTVPATTEVTYPDGTTVDTNGGEVSIDITTNEDGDLVVSNYTATDLNGDSIFAGDSSVSFPESIVINGTSYPVTGITEPVTISASNGIWGRSTCSIDIPEGYTYICDEAFQSVTASNSWFGGSTTFTYNLPSTLTYLGYHAIKLNVSNGSVVVNYAGTREQFKALVNASAEAYTGTNTYCFFTASGTNRCTVTCSDGNVVYRQDGTVYSG